MYIRIKTVDGKTSITVVVSKQQSVSSLKDEIKKSLKVPVGEQRLFYGGKQLDDSNTLFDYGVNLNDVIQLMIDSGKSVPIEDDCINKGSTKTDEIQAESKYFKIGDLVDAKEEYHGSWMEAEIFNILKNKDAKQCTIDCDDDGLLYEVKFCGTEDIISVPLKSVRPRSRNFIPLQNLKTGDRVLVNYNIDNPSKRGYWYDFTVEKFKKTRHKKWVSGTISAGVEETMLKNCKIFLVDEIMAIEERKFFSVKSCEKYSKTLVLRKVAAWCSECDDSTLKIKCRGCGCAVCGLKSDDGSQVMCDECDKPYHIWCVNPPLSAVPEVEQWYCPKCRVNKDEVVMIGDKLKTSKKKSKTENSNRDWGKGMACVGRTKVCTLVPANHFGPIPGVEVGTTWKFRLQVSEAGVHRPPVSGIAGRASEGAFSIVISGGYDDPMDTGDEFLYTGSGGRDLSGNKRTAEQSCDQELTQQNRALALNCNAPVNENGAEAVEWKKGKPVRVVRNHKLRKFSKFAPVDGNRYDGIYKIVKYYKEKGLSGFYSWRYLFRRDDTAPAPWTKEGRKIMEQLGLMNIIYPDGYIEAMKQKNNASTEKISLKRVLGEISDNALTPKRQSTSFDLGLKLKSMIESDKQNTKLWSKCMLLLPDGKQRFLTEVQDVFLCVCCQDVVSNPITLPCLHNVCENCLKRSFAAQVYTCPSCRFELGKNFKIEINKTLANILLELFPGYHAGR